MKNLRRNSSSGLGAVIKIATSLAVLQVTLAVSAAEISKSYGVTPGDAFANTSKKEIREIHGALVSINHFKHRRGFVLGNAIFATGKR